MSHSGSDLENPEEKASGKTGHQGDLTRAQQMANFGQKVFGYFQKDV